MKTDTHHSYQQFCRYLIQKNSCELVLKINQHLCSAMIIAMIQTTQKLFKSIKCKHDVRYLELLIEKSCTVSLLYIGSLSIKYTHSVLIATKYQLRNTTKVLAVKVFIRSNKYFFNLKTICLVTNIDFAFHYHKFAVIFSG